MNAGVVKYNQKCNKNEKLPAKMPWVIPANCEGCGACANSCKNGGLRMTETNVKGVFVPWLEEPQTCTGCGRCAQACVMGAISMTSYVEMASRRFREKKPEIPLEEII
jgi:ferredoxin